MCPFQDKCPGLRRAKQVGNGIPLLSCWMSQGNYLQHYKLDRRNIDLHFNEALSNFLLRHLINTKGGASLSDLKCLPAKFYLRDTAVINGNEMESNENAKFKRNDERSVHGPQNCLKLKNDSRVHGLLFLFSFAHF